MRGPHSKEPQRKIHGNSGRKLTAQHKEAIGRAGLGRKRAEATKQKISKANTGRKHSAETRAHFSKIRKGKPAPWVRARMLGRKITLSPRALERLIRANKSRALPEDERKRRRAEASRHQALMSRYGISAAEYDKILAGQRGLCWICRSPCSSGQRLAVDHDHNTGDVRGLLCRRCNRGLGILFTEALVNSAVRYLMEARRKNQSAVTCNERRASLRQARRKRSSSHDPVEYMRRWRYGLSGMDYNRMLARQHGVCGICKRTCKQRERLSVDHDHETDKIRGLLCSACNLGLGHFSTKTLRRALLYLKRRKQA
jgi:hypothetical protein